jgi:hypothetical protein
MLEVESVASGHSARRNGAQGFGLSHAERQGRRDPRNTTREASPSEAGEGGSRCERARSCLLTFAIEPREVCVEDPASPAPSIRLSRKIGEARS